MTGLVLVAAGSGQRLGCELPKALVSVGGRTLIEHCLLAVGSVPRIRDVVVVAPSDHLAAVRVAVDGRAVVVPGGSTRDESVRAGLAALAPGTERVLVHDAARPFVPTDVFDRVIDALDAVDAVIPAVPVADTIKRVRDGVVVGTPAREELMAVQTPQGFRVSVLLAAHRQRSGEVTDDAMVVEQAGVPVHVVAGSPRGFKITTPFDLTVAGAVQEGV